MIRQDHLEVYDLYLSVKSPIFIGNGHSYTKKEYLYSPSTGMVSILDQDRFFNQLVQRRLVDSYERFILGSNRGLYEFLTSDCRFTPRDIQDMTRYSVRVGDALDDTHTLKEIFCFIRNAAGNVYIPGSSIKGAIRTVLLTDMLGKMPDNRREAIDFEDKRGFEDLILNTLSMKKNKDGAPDIRNAVNSLLRGIQISDSEVIPDSQITLCQKIDFSKSGYPKKIPLVRECLSPGTVIRCKLTLDRWILKDSITADTIRRAIDSFDDFYQTTYLSYFPTEKNLLPPHHILLGGGAGFWSKTVTYPAYRLKALEKTSFILQKAFRDHRHEDDISYGISPRTVKKTKFNRSYVPFGICEVTIQ